MIIRYVNLLRPLVLVQDTLFLNTHLKFIEFIELIELIFRTDKDQILTLKLGENFLRNIIKKVSF